MYDYSRHPKNRLNLPELTKAADPELTEATDATTTLSSDPRQVANAPFIHGLRFRSINGEPLTFAFARNVKVKLTAMPVPNLGRGTTIAGGREYSSSEWHQGEFIELRNANGRTVARLMAPTQNNRAAELGARQINDAPVIVVDLPTGTYTTAADPEFIGGYELHIRETA
jgi:hypothetical protein